MKLAHYILQQWFNDSNPDSFGAETYKSHWWHQEGYLAKTVQVIYWGP